MGMSQGCLLCPLYLVIKQGFYILKQLLCVVKIKWSHQNVIAVKMSCQNDLVKMSYCMSGCSGFKISLSNPQNITMFLIKAKTVSRIPPWSLEPLLTISQLIHSLISRQCQSIQYWLIYSYQQQQNQQIWGAHNMCQTLF